MRNIAFSPPYITQEAIAEVVDTLKSGWITTGPKTKRFEADLAKYVGVEYCHCVNSATSGLLLALKLLGIGKGDEVIVPSYTYCVTALVVQHIGATPIMVDSKPDDFNISIEDVANKISHKTKAIIPVDIGGYPCDYNELFELVEKKKSIFQANNNYQASLGRITIIGDSAHSLGSIYHGKMIGAVADLTIFSFHAVKNLTTAEGGAICLNLSSSLSEQGYKELTLMSLNGQTKSALAKSKGANWKYDIVVPGFKANMSDISAALGLVQLKMYDHILRKREAVFNLYNKEFKNYDWSILPPDSDTRKRHSFHLYQLRIVNFNEGLRDRVISLLNEVGVSANVHFIPLPLLTVFKNGSNIKEYPNSFKNYENEISLPIYPHLSIEDQKYVIKSVISVVNHTLNEI